MSSTVRDSVFQRIIVMMFQIGSGMERSRRYGWMVQKGKERRTWSISLTVGLVSFISSSPGLSFFLMLVQTPGGLGMRLVLLSLLAGLFSTGVMPRLVALILSEFHFCPSLPLVNLIA